MTDNVRLLASAALEGALADHILPAFSRSTGVAVALTTGTVGAMTTALAGNAPIDAVIGARSLLTSLPPERIRVATITPLVRAPVGLGAQAGTIAPAAATTEAWLETLRGARCVAHSASGASGTAFARFAEKVGGIRTLVVGDGPVGAAVLDGRADLAVQGTSELLAFGIPVIAEFPSLLLAPTAFDAALAAGPVHAATGSLLRFLCTPDSSEAFRAAGLVPHGDRIAG